MSGAARRALGAAVLAAGAAADAQAASPATTRSTMLLVRWGANAGSESFRADVARALAQSLRAACLPRIQEVDDAAASPDADLSLSVILFDALDEVRYDDSIAGALQSDDPGHELRRVARFEVSMEATLEARGAGAVIRRKRARSHIFRRPMVVGEDPRETAQTEAIDDLVREVRKGMCKDGDKLERDVAAALAAEGEDAEKR
ncbi:MAG TPA: hypothetical protein VFB67_07580 [Candidatus Polarisedimenticolaceae bacterium]|nr:hypothetical protein [Candidatus Polarisedimenticolaceae bacterium]